MNFLCAAQGILSIGAKLGLGASVFPLHAMLDDNDSTWQVYSGTTLTTGILAQYLIGNRIGIESGLHLTHYSYYEKKDASIPRNRVWKSSATTEVFNFQLPVALFYKFTFPSNPFKDIKLVGGTSIDWLSSDLLLQPSRALTLKNIYTSIRIGNERVSGRRLEYGLEFQYSLDRYSLKGTTFNQPDNKLSSRLSVLTLNLYYFFYNKTIG
jgi:hypothetical protein